MKTAEQRFRKAVKKALIRRFGRREASQLKGWYDWATPDLGDTPRQCAETMHEIEKEALRRTRLRKQLPIDSPRVHCYHGNTILLFSPGGYIDPEPSIVKGIWAKIFELINRNENEETNNQHF